MMYSQRITTEQLKESDVGYRSTKEKGDRYSTAQPPQMHFVQQGIDFGTTRENCDVREHETLYGVKRLDRFEPNELVLL